MTTTFKRYTVVTPADNVPGPKQGQWTYQHYATLPENGQRYEIVDGVLYMAPPSPSGPHQKAVTRLSAYLVIHVEFAGLGQVYSAPFDVELAPNVVVQPDIIVVLNENKDKIMESRIIGAPDLVVEVSSPSTVVHDLHRKYIAYTNAGVKEYWIVDPSAHTVEILMLENGEYYSAGIFSGTDTLPSHVVPEFPVEVQQFFA